MGRKKEYVQLGRRKIGVVGVDSGQVVICDPCYIDREWDRYDGYKDERFYDVIWEGAYSVVDMVSYLKRGKNYDSPLRKYGNKSMNELVKIGAATRRPTLESHVFGYDGCCKASMNPNGGGQLNYRMGHAGAGVAVQSGYGDGLYPVYVRYDKDGRVRRVEIDFT